MDILSPALTLEEDYYAEGYTEGQIDGAKAGLEEGRAFGFKTGFNKFSSIGRLHGRSIVWNSRMRIPSPPNPSEPQSTDAKPRNPNTARRRNLPDFLETAISTTTGHDDDDHEGQDDEDEELLPPTNIAMTSSARILPPLLSPGAVVGTRLQKHITTLFALSEPDSLRLENCEDAVAEFEDRYRRALAKEGIVRRILGEGRDVVVDGSGGNSGGGGGGGGGEGEVEDMVEAKIVSGRSNGLQGLEEQGDLEVEIR